MNLRILLRPPAVPVRQEKTFRFHWGHYKLSGDQNSHVTEVLLRRHRPQNQRAPVEPPRTTCWLKSSSGCGRVAGPARHKRQTCQPSAQTRKETHVTGHNSQIQFRHQRFFLFLYFLFINNRHC